MGDRVAVLKDGVLQQVDAPRELYENPRNVFVAGFIGSPAMNLIQLPIVAGGVQFGNEVLPVDADILGKTSATSLTVGLRPENLGVAANGQGVTLEIDVVEELGADAYLYGRAQLASGEVELVARVDAVNHPKAGTTAIIAPTGGVLHLFDVESGNRLN